MKNIKLISLYQTKEGTKDKETYIRFAHYKNGKYTGEYEEAYLKDNELYKAFKHLLTKEKEVNI